MFVATENIYCQYVTVVGLNPMFVAMAEIFSLGSKHLIVDKAHAMVLYRSTVAVPVHLIIIPPLKPEASRATGWHQLCYGP